MCAQGAAGRHRLLMMAETELTIRLEMTLNAHTAFTLVNTYRQELSSRGFGALSLTHHPAGDEWLALPLAGRRRLEEIGVGTCGGAQAAR